MFTYKTTVKMHDTDAAGVLFFGNQFKMIHDAYEEMIERLGVGFATILKKTDFFVPIVHAEADYKTPLFVGDKITVKIRLARVGKSSFAFSYVLLGKNNKIVGTAKTVHVTTNQKTKKKIPLPDKIRLALKKMD